MKFFSLTSATQFLHIEQAFYIFQSVRTIRGKYAIITMVFMTPGENHTVAVASLNRERGFFLPSREGR